MLRDKPYILFFWITILSMLLMATKLLALGKKATESTYWIFVFRDGLPYLGGLSLLLAIIYLLMFKFKRPTHPLLNIIQLITLLVSYIGFSYMMGILVRDSNTMRGSFVITKEASILSSFSSISMGAVFVILIVNVVLSIAKPNIGR